MPFARSFFGWDPPTVSQSYAHRFLDVSHEVEGEHAAALLQGSTTSTKWTINIQGGGWW
jgi:hypothetical protein